MRFPIFAALWLGGRAVTSEYASRFVVVHHVRLVLYCGASVVEDRYSRNPET